MDEKFVPVEWANGANIYEVNVRQYTSKGTFAAFEKHLPRLRDMGVDVLWFMPITPISSEKRLGSLGSYYACSDYTSVNPEFGTFNDFKSLVDSAHSMGFKVMIDWVANHTGWDHVWTTLNPGFYKKNEEGKFFEANGWEDVIDLDYANASLRKAMIAAMHFWVESCGIDGFRCDMAHLVPLDFWKEARTSIDRIKKLFWLAETEEPYYHKVFDATYAWELLHKMEAIYKGTADVKLLYDVLKKYNTTFPDDALRLLFITNHDENSHSGSEFERMGESVKAFAVLCATWPNGVPLIYSGQELPNTKRLKFFDKDEIDWNENIALHDFYKRLLLMHKQHPALNVLQTETIILSIATHDYVFGFVRKNEDRKVLVLLNLSANNKVKFEIENVQISGKFKSAFSGIEVDFTNDKSFEMQAWEYLVYEC